MTCPFASAEFKMSLADQATECPFHNNVVPEQQLKDSARIRVTKSRGGSHHTSAEQAQLLLAGEDGNIEGRGEPHPRILHK